jgi:hypothetical protein
MEPLVLTALLLWGLTRYAGTELMATARGTEPPRIRERRERAARAHERAMAKRASRTGPSVGEALAKRIADRIANPRGPKPPGPARQAMGEWWADSWNYATDRRRRRHERHEAGNLGRQRAARMFRNWFGRRGPEQDRRPSGPRWVDAQVVDDAEATDDIVDAEVVEEPPQADTPTKEKPPASPRPETPPPPREPTRPHDQPPATAQPDEPETATTTTNPDARTASVHPIRKALPMTSPNPTLTSGETLDPAAARAFTEQMANLGQQIHAQLELSVASLTERGVSGEPINLLCQMQENAAQFMTSSQSAKAHFERHMNTQDVVLSDDTLAGTVKTDTYLGARS